MHLGEDASELAGFRYGSPMRRPGLSYANVMSTVAVVLAMSGTAVAATQISGSTIKDRTIGHKKLALNTVTGAEVKESSLGRVPSASSATNAGKLDGIDSTGFVGGWASGLPGQAARPGERHRNQCAAAHRPRSGFADCDLRGVDPWLDLHRHRGCDRNRQPCHRGHRAPHAAVLHADADPPVSAYAAWSHNNGSTESAGVYDDLWVLSQGSAHPAAHVQLTGLTDIQSTGKCDAAVVVTVQ